MIDEKTMTLLKELFINCSPYFLGLGDAQRQKLIMDIASSGEEGINVNSLAAISNLSRPAVSHHLKVLKDYGLVISVKKGTQIFYRLKLLDAMKKVRALLDEMEKIAVKLNFESMES